MKTLRFVFLLIAVGFLLIQGCTKPQLLDDYQKTADLFKNPPAEYTTAPFWVWDGQVTQKTIDDQLAEYRQNGIMQLIIHPRPGLITPYLTDEWFNLVKYATARAKAMGMKLWLYDENSYPSGFAGGNVPAQMPEAAAVMMQRIITTRPDTLKQTIVQLFRQNGDKYLPIDSVNPSQNYTCQAFVLIPSYKSGWFGGYSYVDIMQKKVTDEFLDLTIGGYQKYIGDEFGKTIKGIFTDEPNISAMGGGNILDYTPALFDAFRQKYGYDLRTSLPSLFEETGNWRKVRHDYYSALLELFIDNWAKPYSERCDEDKISMTGHYWDHDWPKPTGVPDNMALTAYTQVPGIDVLMNNWYGGFSGQFGNNRIVRELASVANQLGRKRTLSETYGASGWDLNFKDMKRIGDWEYTLGVNLMNQHLSYMSMAGARKRDHPLAFSWADPWWPDYKLMNDYFTRLSVALSQGRQENKILVIEPTTSAWMYFTPAWSPAPANAAIKEASFDGILNNFHQFIDSLENWQVEYDLGCEDIIRNHGTVKKGKICVGLSSYSLVILPPALENLDERTTQLLREFLESGGKVLSTGNIPAYVEGASSAKLMDLASNYSKQWIKAETIRLQDIQSLLTPDVKFIQTESNGFVFHQRRQLQDAQLLFVTNIHDSREAKGTISLRGKSAEEWDPFTGTIKPYPFTVNEEELTVGYSLPAGGSLLLCIRPVSRESIKSQAQQETPVPLTSALEVNRKSPNVLVIDFCDLNIKGTSTKEMYVYQANTQAYKAYGFDRDPWDNAVQYQSEILKRDTFPAGSGFTADYWLNIGKGVNLDGMKLVAERPGIFKVSVNGKTVVPTGETWLDKDFAVYSLDSVLKEGKNKITLSTHPFSIFSELEAIYVLGNFSLKPEKAGFSLAPPKTLQLGSWNSQGMPLFGDRVAYTHAVDLDKTEGSYQVKLQDWSGSCAEVYVNGEKAGIIAFPPYSLDVTNYLKQGRDTIQVVVVGTLRNTLGPLHMNSKGSAWPGMFQGLENGRTLAGDSYVNLPYGLMKDFELIQVK